MNETSIGNIWHAILSALGVICGFLYGELNGLLISVLVLMGIDYITGIASSFVLKTTNSKVGWRGIIKKLVMLLILVMAHILDMYALGIPEGGSALLTLVEFLYIANEGLSIVENAGKMGIKLPQALTDALVQLKLTSNKSTATPNNNNTKSSKDKENKPKT